MAGRDQDHGQMLGFGRFFHIPANQSAVHIIQYDIHQYQVYVKAFDCFENMFAI